MTTVKTEGNGRIVKQEPNGAAPAKPVNPLVSMMSNKAFIEEIARALPKHVTADRMARIVMTALRTTPKLDLCTKESFLGCVLQASQLGLEVNTPLQHCFLIPRKNGKLSRDAGRDIYETTIIIGYQGQIELSMRSNKIGGIQAHVVREGDQFEWELGLNPKLVHKPSDDPKREEKLITHAYAVARIKDAEPAFEVLSAAQLARRAEASSSGNSGPWSTDPEAMCRKSAVRALWKYIPKSAEMARAEMIEQAPELGRSQVTAFDTTVHDSMKALGVQPIDTTAEPEAEPAKAAEATPDAAKATAEGEPQKEPEKAS